MGAVLTRLGVRQHCQILGFCVSVADHAVGVHPQGARCGGWLGGQQWAGFLAIEHVDHPGSALSARAIWVASICHRSFGNATFEPLECQAPALSLLADQPGAAQYVVYRRDRRNVLKALNNDTRSPGGSVAARSSPAGTARAARIL